MTREEFINKKNKAVRTVLGIIEEDIDADKLDPFTYNKIRNAIRYHFNWLLNQVFDYLHMESVPLKREGKVKNASADEHTS